MGVRKLCAAAVVCALSRPVWAQNNGSVDLQAFRPAIDSRGLVTVNASSVLRHREVSFGLVTNWGKSVLRFDGAAGSFYEVQNILTPTLIGAVGLQLGGAKLELGLSVPFAVMSGDRGPDSDGGTPDDPRDDQRFGFDGQGLGNVGLHTKLQLSGASRRRVGLALIGSVRLPASQSGSWISDDGIGAQGTVVLDKLIGRWKLAANAGVRWRGGDTSFRDDPQLMTGAPSTGEAISVGASIPFGAGASWAISEQKVDVIGEVFGDLPIAGRGYLPLEALAGVKVYLAQSSYLLFGGGAGLVSGAGGNPSARAFLGIVFEPRDRDRDGDGIADRDDRCPTSAEDRDDFEDEDGCPELDNDLDGFPDNADECPNEPEDRDGDRDEDGCPDPNDDDELDDTDSSPPPEHDEVRITDIGFEVLEKIYFEFDSAVIQRRSHRILDVVARTIQQHPNVVLIEVQGHTDERGSDAYNLSLSQARAESVVAYLARAGVPRSKLTAKGYGERKPIDRRHNKAAWAKNRRVEFIIKKRAD